MAALPISDTAPTLQGHAGEALGNPSIFEVQTVSGVITALCPSRTRLVLLGRTAPRGCGGAAATLHGSSVHGTEQY